MLIPYQAPSCQFSYLFIKYLISSLVGKIILGEMNLCLSLQQDYKKQMLTAAHALAVDAKNLLDVIDQSRLKMMAHSRPH